MKKTVLFSVCGCFLTSAAVAFTFYVDMNPNSDCPDGYGFCLVKPQDGYCCPAESVVTGINRTSVDTSKSFAGLYMRDVVTDTEVTLFDSQGKAVSTKGFTAAETQMIGRTAVAGAGDASETGNKLSAKEYTKGAVAYLEIGNDDDGSGIAFTETTNPTRSPSCDKVHFKLKTCTTYKYNPNGGGTTCQGPTLLGEIYYKQGAGYFTSSNYSSGTRIKDETGSGNLLSVPTRANHVFRGFFTSVWTDAVAGSSSLTDVSSYINNLSPYRTIGHAYIPWKNDIVNGNTSGNELFLRAPNWVVSGPGVTCPSTGYEMDLYAGWAENCADGAYCKMTITGKTGKNLNYMVTATNGSSITGQWLPGAVKYERVQTCKEGTASGTTNVTKKYGSQSLTFELGTSELGCNGNVTPEPTPTGGQITINYYNTNGTRDGYKYCNVGENVKLEAPWTGITKLKYKGDTTSGITFNNGGTYACKVGTGGFTQYIKTGDNYIVNFEPYTIATDPTDDEDGKKVNVTLDLKGGNLRGDTSGEDTFSIKVENGETLSGYVVETKIGQPEFTGWKLRGDTSGVSNKNAVVNAEAGSNVVYEAAYACPDGTKEFSGTCLNVERGSDGKEQVTDTIIDRSGNVVDPTQGATCWREQPGGGRINYCYWNMTIEFHDKPAGSTLNVVNQNDGKQMQCYGTPCKPLGNMTCAEYFPTGNCKRMNFPTASGYRFRGYYRQTLPNNMVTDVSTTDGAAFSKFYPGVDFGKHATIIMNDAPVDSAAVYPTIVHVYGAWAKDCNPGENATCNRTISTAWAVSNGMNKGDVRYDTGCADGYVIASGAGAYNPTCTTEKGNDITISYTFKDQFGRTVRSSGAPSSCTAADNFSLPNSSFVQSALGSNYSPKYFAMTDINGAANWYSPSRSLACGTNTFGPMTQTTGGGYSTSVVGTVCYNFCTIGQRYGEHGTCVAMTGSGPTAAQLGISYPKYYASNGGYYIVNDNYNVANLWEGCPTVQCDSATGTNGANYGLYVDPDSAAVSCVVKTGGGDAPTFTCPTISSLGITLPDGVMVGAPSQSGQTCTYTLSCGNNPRVALAGGTGTISCTGGGNTAAGCNANTLRNLLNGYSCNIACPQTVGSGENVEVRFDSNTANTCKYKVFCHAKCSATGCTLTYDGAILGTKGNVYVECTGDDCFSPISPNPNVPSTLINPSLRFSDYDCVDSPSLTKCPAAGWFKSDGHLTNYADVSLPSPNSYKLPAAVTMALQSATPSSGQCTYNMGCTSGTLNGDNPFTCSGNSGANACTVTNMRSKLNNASYTCGTGGGN